MLLAMPSSTALAMPRRSTKSGPQARVVPMPPVSEIEPVISPARGSRPNTPATPMPSRFCSTMKPEDRPSSHITGLPPSRNVRKSDLSPMPAKKYSSSMSRTPRSNSMRRPSTI
ncbi:hypothetical protein D3C78_1381980 [compost metagenome]